MRSKPNVLKYVSEAAVGLRPSCAGPAAWTCVRAGCCGTRAFWRKSCFVLSKGGGQNEHAMLAPQDSCNRGDPTAKAHVTCRNTCPCCIHTNQWWHHFPGRPGSCLSVCASKRAWSRYFAPPTAMSQIIERHGDQKHPNKRRPWFYSQVWGERMFRCYWWIKLCTQSRNNFTRGDCGAERSGCRKREQNSETILRKSLTCASDYVSLYDQTDPMTYSWSGNVVKENTQKKTHRECLQTWLQQKRRL